MRTARRVLAQDDNVGVLASSSELPQHGAMLLELGDVKVRSWRKDDLKSLVLRANNAKIAANLRDQRRVSVTHVNEIDIKGDGALLDVCLELAEETDG